ncbi:MAG: ATP-binding protein [Burkholderiaceae bacterium]
MAREIQLGLGLPLLVFLPVALLAIVLSVKASLAPLRRLRDGLSARGARDLSLVPAHGLPTEIAPVAETVNELLGRLAAAFEAERSFATNAAHELRTPLAGAIAQAQRLQAETQDGTAKTRAADIESTLKRLTRLSDSLMQLARAEGARLRLGHASDLRVVARLLTKELSRLAGQTRISLTLPDDPVMSDLDPDVFAMLFNNLVENALRHGSDGAPIDVSLTRDGLLTVANDGPVVAGDSLSRLIDRFERAGKDANGAGLGLAIVNAVARRIGATLVLKSPRTGREAGFEASLNLPIASAGAGQGRLENPSSHRPGNDRTGLSHS